MNFVPDHDASKSVVLNSTAKNLYASKINDSCDDLKLRNSSDFNNGFNFAKSDSHKETAVFYDNPKKSTENKADDLNSNGSNDMHTLYRLAASLGLSNADNGCGHDWYYGVYVPPECRLQYEEDQVYVYTDKTEALKSMKQWKKSRFKQFKTWREAEKFAQNGIEPASPSCSVGTEKPMPFKGPKAQDMIRFRKAIECGDIAVVKAAIEENPRYLFSSGDTPSILQEGCRYNALHVTAKSNQATIAELILTSVQSIPLLARLFEDCDEAALRGRSAILLDLYLNTPDKSCNETPLHFAVKYGAVEVVELLTSFPQCQRGLLNKYGASVQDLVCTRINDEGGKIKKTILTLLEDRYFLPVLRYEDNSLQPRIGEPFSLNKPLEVKEDPLSPRLEIQAFAGPMAASVASEFRKKWRTPPPGLRASALRLCDHEKGLERIGRNLASDLKVPWREYWSFLDTFVDLSSPEGLILLEKYLQKRFNETLLELVTPELEKQEAPSTTVQDVLSPISDLCQVFQAISLNDGHRGVPDTRDRRRALKDFTRKPSRKDLHLSRKGDDLTDEICESNQQFSPILCVERSCQVFGKRIATAMLHICSNAELDNFDSDLLKDSLDPELKHLQALVTRYMDDSRFRSIDFRLVHTRVATIAASPIIQQATPKELLLLQRCLREIDLTDGTVSDDEDLMYSTRESQIKTLGAILKAHVLCLAQSLMFSLDENGPAPASVTTEAECEVLWSRVTPCSCAWDAKSHFHARYAWRRRHKLPPKPLNFKSEESSSIEESWRSCEDATPCSEEDDFKTPPSSPVPKVEEEEDELYDATSQPDTFIYPGDKPSKTDLAVAEAVASANLTAQTYPAIFRWKHLVELHKNQVVPYGQDAPSPGAWHRRRLIPLTPSPKTPDTPNRSSWERITGALSPRRPTRPRFASSPSGR